MKFKAIETCTEMVFVALDYGNGSQTETSLNISLEDVFKNVFQLGFN